MTLVALVLLGQIADGLAYSLMIRAGGIEGNPTIAALAVVAPILPVKIALGVVLAIGAWALVRRGRRHFPAWLAVIGFVGCLSELLAVVA